MESGRYLRKGRHVDALQWDGTPESFEAIHEMLSNSQHPRYPISDLIVGTWIIHEIDGSVWACSNVRFEHEFTPVQTSENINTSTTHEARTSENHINIGPECFINGDVISYKGEDYYRACKCYVLTRKDWGMSFCVKRHGHAGNAHEDYDGNIRHEPIMDDLSDNAGTLLDQGYTKAEISERLNISSDPDRDNFIRRHLVWEKATELVDDAVEKAGGLEEYVVGPGAFNLTQGSTMTKVDQYIDHVRSVANWLLLIERD